MIFVVEDAPLALVFYYIKVRGGNLLLRTPIRDSFFHIVHDGVGKEFVVYVFDFVDLVRGGDS